MINLAGKQDCDINIKDELKRAGIKVVKKKGEGEVPYNYEGRLKGFKFKRAWSYWIVNGLTPLKIAEKLMKHPEGKANIRAGGCAGNHPLKGYVIVRFDEKGKEIIQTKKFNDQIDPYKNSSKPFTQKVYNDFIKKYVPKDNPEEYEGYVDVYHIDTQAGLLLFAETIRREL